MVKIGKIIQVILVCVIFLNIIVPVYSQADNFETSTYDSLSGDVPTEVDNITNNFLNTAINVVRIAGVSIALVIIMVIGCKYMMSAPGDRADIKKNAIPFLIGAVVLFASSGILGIIADVAATITVT